MMLPNLIAFLKRMTLASVIGNLVIGVAQANENSPPPGLPWRNVQAPFTLKHAPVSHLHLGALDVIFEKTPLADIQKTLLSGVIGEQGDASENLYWLCYTITEKLVSQRVWIISSGEFGGPQHFVDAIAATTIKKDDAETSSCPELPSKFRPISLDNGIWLGRSREEVIHRLGKPSWESDGRMEFNYAGKVAIKNKQVPSANDKVTMFDVSVSVAVEVLNNFVDRLWVSKTTQD